MLYGGRARRAEGKAGGDDRRPTRKSGLWVERDEAHAIWPEKGRGTSMPTQEPCEANADNRRLGLGGSRRECYGLGFPPRPEISRSLPWHMPVDVRLGGGGCREDFQPQAETRGKRAKWRGAAEAHKGDREARVGRGPKL